VWAPLARILGLKPAPPISVRGEAFAAPLATIHPTPGAVPSAAALAFTPAESYRDDPVFLSRVQWRLQELLYDGAEPSTPAEATTRDKFRKMGLVADRPRTYHLSDAFTPSVPLFVADVALSPAHYAAGLDFGDHDSLFRVRYDLSGSRAAAELVADFPNPTTIARLRLDGLLNRGARFVWAELVQANYRLYQPGTDSAACMVMFSFDYAVSADEMRVWGEQLHPLKFTNPTDPVLRQAVWPLEVDDQAWYYHRRFRMPEAFTGGRTVYLADLWAHRPFIDGRFRSRQELGDRPRRVPLLAEKKEAGWAGIELVPFNEADEYQRRATRQNT
jgi:hypothetical protein